VLINYDRDKANVPQVYDNPKQPGTVVVRLSYYKCLVTSPVQARAIMDELKAYFEAKGEPNGR
jgi:hypothetical protein